MSHRPKNPVQLVSNLNLKELNSTCFFYETIGESRTTATEELLKLFQINSFGAFKKIEIGTFYQLKNQIFKFYIKINALICNCLSTFYDLF
ncbi:hypothetical protein ACFOG5_12560 [Pedobacter fastidiosus]|uniref:hypothetical protein n=1 Tax=Pedobacter fastidiosus TaxID=2765361 RepID=UPI0036188133